MKESFCQRDITELEYAKRYSGWTSASWNPTLLSSPKVHVLLFKWVLQIIPRYPIFAIWKSAVPDVVFRKSTFYVGFYSRLDPIYRINHSSGPVVNIFLANTVLRRCKLKNKALRRCYAYNNWAIPSQGGGVPRECNGNWGGLWNRRPAGICVHKVSWLNKASFFS